MGERVYPPQPWIHQTDCVDAPPNLPPFQARSAGILHPMGRPHHCVNAGTIVFNRDCVAEFVTYEPHPYTRSTIWPADATGPLCHTCRGSHPESRIAAFGRTRPRDDIRW